jgi:hypothetical protein
MSLTMILYIGLDKNQYNNAGRAAKRATPPVIRGNVEGTHTFRFRQIEEASSTINLYADDLAFLMSVASGSGTVRCLWESIKIQRINIWTPSRQYGGTLQDPRETSLTWSGEYSPRSEIFGTVNQQTGVCMISSAPPRMSASGRWQKTGQGAAAQPLVILKIPDQSIVDITVSFVFDDGTTQISLTKGSGNTLGALYYCPADAYYGSSKLTPMGLTAPA